MNQKEQEVIAFKRFFELQGIVFNDQLLSTSPEEPADLEYNGQGYQITTGDGEYTGKILSASKKNGAVDRLMNTNDYVVKTLEPILKKKQIRASEDIILIVTIHTKTPFSDEQLKDKLQKFTKTNLELIKAWKTVYCVYPFQKFVSSLKEL